jgi:hypothetical protein
MNEAFNFISASFKDYYHSITKKLCKPKQAELFCYTKLGSDFNFNVNTTGQFQFH